MKKKNDKIIMILITFVIYFIASWVLEGGLYGAAGIYTSVGYSRMGLFDIIEVIYSAFYYRISDIVFLFGVGGCYEVLSHTLMYRKLQDKLSKAIKGKEEIVMVVVTSLMAIYTSLTSNILIMFIIAPFIVSLFLRNNYNRLTAFSAGFGGMFLGYVGLTYGTYNMSVLNETLSMQPSDWIVQKWIILFISIAVFNFFNILYMKKYKNNKDQVKHDMFAAEVVTEAEEKMPGKKKKKGVKVWPLVLVMIITLAVILVGYIDWSSSFNVGIFDKLYTNINKSFQLADIPIFATLFGTKFTAIGTWQDLLYALFVFVVGVIVVALMSKIKLNEFINLFANGMKKMTKVVFIYGFATSVLYLMTAYPWPVTIISKLLGSGTFNIIIVFIVAILATIFTGDAHLCSYLFSSALVSLYGNDIIAAGNIWRIGGAIAMMVGPTSFILLATLTYLNIPYKAWLKYIWKFVAIFSIILMLMLAVIIYV